METFRKGDIVIFPFPYTDLSKRKLRPCLVISNEMNEDIILCQITSQKIRADKFSVELKKYETIEGTLFIDSYVRTNMIFTADKSLVVKKICRVDDNKYNDVINNITRIISK